MTKVSHEILSIAGENKDNAHWYKSCLTKTTSIFSPMEKDKKKSYLFFSRVFLQHLFTPHLRFTHNPRVNVKTTSIFVPMKKKTKHLQSFFRKLIINIGDIFAGNLDHLPPLSSKVSPLSPSHSLFISSQIKLLLSLLSSKMKPFITSLPIINFSL